MSKRRNKNKQGQNAGKGGKQAKPVQPVGTAAPAVVEDPVIPPGAEFPEGDLSAMLATDEMSDEATAGAGDVQADSGMPEGEPAAEAAVAEAGEAAREAGEDQPQGEPMPSGEPGSWAGDQAADEAATALVETHPFPDVPEEPSVAVDAAADDASSAQAPVVEAAAPVEAAVPGKRKKLKLKKHGREPEPEAIAELQAEPQPEAVAESEPEAVASFDAAAEPVAELEAVPEPEAVPAVEPEPVAEPLPEPVPVARVRRARRGERVAAFAKLTDYQNLSLAHVPGLPEESDVPGHWRGVGFGIGGRRLVSAFDEVVEIMRLPAITHVPGTQPWMLGVANVRGTLLPVVDLKQFLEGERTVMHEGQRVLVVRQAGGNVAVLIDQLFGQRSFNDSQKMETRADTGTRFDHFIKQFYRVGENDWGVFSMTMLTRTPEFRQAAA